MSVHEVDHGAERIGRLIHELSGPSAPWAAIGVQGADAGATHGDGPLSAVEIAVVHEFGARLPNGTVIPMRSFLRATIDAHGDEIAAFKLRVAHAMLAGRLTAEQGTALMGKYVVGLVQQRIANRIDPELADATIERKGSSVPLIDVGQLRTSIVDTVRRGRS